MATEIPESFGAVKLDGSGRLVVPQALRVKKGLQSGDELVFSIVPDGRIVLSTFDEAISAIQDAFCALVPVEVNLVEDLLTERRAEAASEAHESH
jgi:bifunctional DNA-binding transcriptional regulator/antitoxin component of YhaV-PrlF toxin-antitoxin module